MAAVTPGDVLRRIAAGELAPIYLLLGDDEREKVEVVEAVERTVDDGLRAFNVERLHGPETGLDAVIDATRTLPMMAPRRVVILTRAEHCLMPKRESQAAIAALTAFEAYLKAPAEHATLVIVAGDLDKRRTVTRALTASATVVVCGDVETVDDAERWVRRQVAAEGRRIAPAAARQLAAVAGPDLARLRGDVDRLLLYTAGQETIGADDVQAIAGTAVAHDDWAVARAIEQGRAGPALRELALVLESGAAPPLVLGQLAWVARAKLPPARVTRAVEAVFRADLALKSSAGDPRILLERLVLELCGVAEPARSARH